MRVVQPFIAVTQATLSLEEPPGLVRVTGLGVGQLQCVKVGFFKHHFLVVYFCKLLAIVNIAYVGN